MRRCRENPWHLIKSPIIVVAVIINVEISFGDLQWFFKKNHQQQFSSRNRFDGFLQTVGKKETKACQLQRENVILLWWFFCFCFSHLFSQGNGT